MVSDEILIDDQSHYEVSLTAGQAFIAFVLLLLSLAATFAFGLMIGRGQADERLVVRKEPAVINEGSVVASKKNPGKLVDLGVGNDDFKAPAPLAAATGSAIAETATAAPTITEGTTTPLTAARPETAAIPSAAGAAAPAAKPAAVATAGPAYAQLLVTSDQKTADALAANLIDHGFMSSYVERVISEKGVTFKVRVKFPSEAEARASEAKLKELAKDVWIVK
jgi:SPOR domain